MPHGTGRTSSFVLCTFLPRFCSRSAVAAADYFGRVSFNGLPVPGATVTATQRDQQLTTVTDQDGVFRLPALADGSWNVRVEMIGFAAVDARRSSPAEASPASTWELKMLPLAEMTLTVTAAGRVLSDPAPRTGGSERTRPADAASAPPSGKSDRTRPANATAPAPAGFQRAQVCTVGRRRGRGQRCRPRPATRTAARAMAS